MIGNKNIGVGKRVYTEDTRTQFTVVGGANGWIDTDVSAKTGTNTDRLWVVSIQVAAAQYAGARQHGSAIDTLQYASTTTLTLVRVDGNGHVDLYRSAADAYYTFEGYLQ